MILNDRQKRIVETLVVKENISVEELSSIFKVSTVTIRNDLTYLSNNGHVIRTHGGARIFTERVRQEYSFATRQRLNATSKKKIGELAAKLIEPNDSVLLDSSSTAVAVAQAIRRLHISYEISVFVTGIWTALELLGDPHIHVIVPGGNVRDTTGSFTGNLTKEFLKKFNFNKALLGAWGVDIHEGLTDTQVPEVELKQDIIARSKEVVGLVDSSKFGRIGLLSFATTEQINKIVTDKSIPSEYIKLFKDKSVEVLITK